MQVLHDHLQQLLVGANLRLNLVSRGASATQQEGLANVRQLIDEAIGASRSLTMELAPPILHEAGLAAGLEWLARWIKQTHGLDVHLNVDERAVAEREDVRVFLFQSVRELLFNVVKHAGVSEAEVSVRVPDPEHLVIVVSDQGAGFDLHAALRSDSGEERGFGLFTIRERLSLLGGRLDIVSEEGRGTQFILVAPMHITTATTEYLSELAASELESQPRVVRTGPETIRVLVVDDHKVMREGLESLLADEPGVSVVGEAEDGVEALERAVALRPDIVLMDFSLPKMDGVEATRRIKSELPDTKVIGLSMYEEPDRAAAMIDAGASAYLTKSGNSDNLLATIHAVHDSPLENAER